MKLLYITILLAFHPVHAECLVDKIEKLEQDVKNIHAVHPMDNYFVWMAEIEKVKNDAGNMEGWINRAEDSVAKINNN
jgi:hypothetical protein